MMKKIRWFTVGFFVTMLSLGTAAVGPLGAVKAKAETAGGTNTVYLPVTVNNYSPCSYQATAEPFYTGYQSDMPQVNADEAWADCLYGSGVTVAVVDTGVNLTHQDLAANVLSGYDFVGSDTDPSDENGHGTHVAGTIAAALNGVGMLGMAPEANILPVQVMNASGSGSVATVAAGIDWAVAHGAQVINLSVGTPENSETLYDAVKAAYNSGALVVAAAGNDGQYDSTPSYPAAYDNYVLAVAAVDNSNAHAYFSNTGSYLDVSAPGVNIFSAYYLSNISYAYYSGTSQAAPHVSGLAALIWGQDPSLTNAQVWAIINSSATDLGTIGFDTTFGYGLIDAQAALTVSAADAASLAADMEQAAAAEEPTFTDNRTAKIQAGVVLVRFADGALENMDVSTLGITAVQTLGGLDNTYQVSVTPGDEWAAVDSLRQTKGVVYAEPDYLVTIQ